MKSIAVIALFALFSFPPVHAKEASDWGHDWPDGYLTDAETPDGIALLPPSPTWGTPRQLMDEALNAEALKLVNTPRFELAAKDADLNFPNAAENFACALGVPIGTETTPTLYNLMRRTMTDAGGSTKTAKEKYQRKRPFQVNAKPICTPDEEAHLRYNGSYPSGHAAIGWAWALILTQISPERANSLLERGKSFGDSRVVCNVHWQSDVVEGRLLGAAVFARLNSVEEFTSDLQKAKSEVAAANPVGNKDCAGEAEALKGWLH